MSNVPTTSLPRQANKLALLLDALDGVPLDTAERGNLTWLPGQEMVTAANLVAVILRARAPQAAESKSGAPCNIPDCCSP
ncbi:MAG: hypothetical protein ACRDS9_07675 [Pseudonocardiaceae bacterium]